MTFQRFNPDARKSKCCVQQPKKQQFPTCCVPEGVAPSSLETFVDEFNNPAFPGWTVSQAGVGGTVQQPSAGLVEVVTNPGQGQVQMQHLGTAINAQTDDYCFCSRFRVASLPPPGATDIAQVGLLDTFLGPLTLLGFSLVYDTVDPNVRFLLWGPGAPALDFITPILITDTTFHDWKVCMVGAGPITIQIDGGVPLATPWGRPEVALSGLTTISPGIAAFHGSAGPPATDIIADNYCTQFAPTGP